LGLWCFSDPGNGAANLNFLAIDILGTGQIQWWSEYATDADSTVVSTATVPATGVFHLALRRNASTGTTHTVSMFINGDLVDTLTGIQNYTGGNSPASFFTLGYGAYEGGNYFRGYMDDVRFSNIARLDAEILESYERGMPSPVVVAGTIYRMRAYDATLGRLVYWNSSTLDATGVDYAGVGPLSDVVLQVTVGQPKLTLVPGTGIEAMPEQWVKLNVPANQPATAMSAQVSTNFDTLKAIRAGSIVGLGTRLNTPITAGALTVRITINGAPGTLMAVHTAGANSMGAQVVQPTGVDDYVAGDLIGTQYATSAGFQPISADLEAWLQVVETP
jgi:hypothetical protein